MSQICHLGMTHHDVCLCRKELASENARLRAEVETIHIENQRLLNGFLKEKVVEQVQLIEKDRNSWRALAEKCREANQACHDYFVLLCKRYHGKKTKSGAPLVEGTEEIEAASNRAGELCLKAIALFPGEKVDSL